MRLIERYIFRQLAWATFWATLALAGVGLLSQSLSGLELIVDQRQSAWVFIKITLLAMPEVLSLIIPLAAFVASLIVLNRLHTEQEIVVCYSGGASRWRVAAPGMRLVAWLVLLGFVLNFWVQPTASRNMREELNAARADLAAALVREGQFTQPADGLTVYAQEVERGGAMRNLFINVQDENGDNVTYTSVRGRLVETDGAPILLMEEAAIYELDEDGSLTYVSTDRVPFDLSPFSTISAAPTTKAADRYMSELLRPHSNDEWARDNRTIMLAEFNARIAEPLYNLTFVAFAIGAVLGGPFNRLGYARRVATMSFFAVAVRIIGFVVEEAAAETAALNVLQYVVPLLAAAVVLFPFLAPGLTQGFRPLRTA